jgi:hypothetical protein
MFCNPIQFKKRVRFSPFITICPNNSFIERQHIPYLWWSELDKMTAYSTMHYEIRRLQMNHPSMSMKQAMKLLYQPDNLTRYDPTNFTSINHRPMLSK